MALILNEEQQLLKDTAKEFVSNNAPINHFREIRDSNNELGYSKDIWKKMVDLGWAGILIPEEYGGSNFGMIGLGSVLEETGRCLVPSPLFSTALLGVSLIELGGNKDQKEELLNKIAEGSLTTSFALEEGPHHSVNSIQTKAEKSKDGFIINGNKTFVLDGHSCDLIILAARTSGNTKDKSGISLFLIDPKIKGVNVKRTHMVDSRNSSDVYFKDVEISSSDLLGELDGGLPIVEQVVERGQIGLSSEMLGSTIEAFDRTLNYLKERKQFGVLIGSFQSLQHRAATMFAEIELVKSSVMGALNAVDENSNDISRFASLAKFKSGETFKLVSSEAVQMHGGVGVTDEYDIGFFLKRSRVAEQIFGSSDYHIDRYAVLSEY
ncbi:MAG: acyl-CoA dehydrogenase [Gammaproteobacteria bacterium]|nr:acyl-CoA dehydrogenase [Gammaproteobacteria bacterium]|tara:strand:+ start:3614 stop:4753 length:1140 start_codon:yes stop_codon:yes gene_type:complete